MAKLIIVIWIICGILTYGITFGYFQGGWPEISEKGYRQDMSFSVFFGLLGPIGLIISFFISGFAEYGLKFK